MFDVVIQGPVNKYLTEIVNSYRHPNIKKIIYSGWDDESMPSTLPGDVEIIRNRKPLFNGPHNTNYQLYSSRAGIEKATSDYVMKIRSDFFLERDILDKIEWYCNNHNRIVTFGVSGSLCFSTWDFMYFGKRQDMKLLFSAPTYNERIVFTTPTEYWSKAVMAETYFTAHYIANFEPRVKEMWDNHMEYLVLSGRGYQEAKEVTAATVPKYFRPLPATARVLWLKHYTELTTLEEVAKRNYHVTVFSPSW